METKQLVNNLIIEWEIIGLINVKAAAAGRRETKFPAFLKAI
jgi:hypothetical protein